MPTYDTHDNIQLAENHEEQDLTPYKEPNRPYSIDLALELEHQLGNDSVPPTPAFPPSNDSGSTRRESLDPHILASIVMQLRHTVAELTKERDAMQHMLSYATSQTADLKDTIQLMVEKSEKMSYELEQARTQNKEDADAITMLRSKVDESRRGLMKLQAEAKQSRRQSAQGPMTLDMSRAGVPALGVAPPSGKRASFSPLAGSYARPPPRGSSLSISDITMLGLPPSSLDGLPSTGLQDQATTFPDHAGLTPNGSSYPPSSSRRFSGLFGRTSPQLPAGPEQSPPRNDVAELEALRRDLKRAKDELEEARHELAESNEAREASEMCVKALRKFIGDNHSTSGPGMDGEMKLPPPPHMAKGEEDDDGAVDSNKNNGSMSGWSFKLWQTGSAPPVKTSSSGSSASSYTKQPMRHTSSASPLPPRSSTASQPPPPAFGRLGGFFSSRANSISSVTSSSSAAPPNQHGSDTSSEAEPASETPQMNVLVKEQDSTGGSNSSLSRMPLAGEEMKGVGGVGMQVLAQ